MPYLQEHIIPALLHTPATTFDSVPANCTQLAFYLEHLGAALNISFREGANFIRMNEFAQFLEAIFFRPKFEQCCRDFFR